MMIRSCKKTKMIKSLSIYLLLGLSWVTRGITAEVVHDTHVSISTNNGERERLSSEADIEATAASKKPNLVMIIVDEHNMRTVSAYRDYLVDKHGKDKVHVWGDDNTLETPHIDSLAKEGAMFTNFYSVAPICTPSRTSFMSGKYPPNRSKNHIAMNSDVTTFAEVLKGKGYSTSYIGKWHLDGNEKPGWGSKDRDFGFIENKYRYNRGHWKYFEDKGDYVQEYTFEDRFDFLNDTTLEEDHFATDFLFDRGVEFIQRAVANDETFATIISIPDPHAPNQIRQPYDTMYKNLTFAVPETGKKAWRYDLEKPAWQLLTADAPDDLSKTDEFIRKIEDPDSWYNQHMQEYFGMVKCIDDNIGKLMGVLANSGIDDNTIVVFTSDHDLLLEHGKSNKNSPYEMSAGIPLLIRYPGTIREDKIIETPYSSVDFAPTILGLMGVDHNLKFVGVEATEDLLSSDLVSANDDSVIFSSDHGHGAWAMAVMRGYKYVVGQYGAPWLYDLNLDPEELINFVDDDGYAQIKDKLQTALIDAIKRKIVNFDFAEGSFLDKPRCSDKTNLIPSRLSYKLCKDVPVEGCEGKRRIKRHCPATCHTCSSEDSSGKLLMPNGQVLRCWKVGNNPEFLCKKSSKVRTFCPTACAVPGGS